MPRKGQFKIGANYWTATNGDPGRAYLGVCLHDQKKIIINPRRPKVERFATAIHEAIHASMPDITEEATLRTEQAIMNTLKALDLLDGLTTEED